MNEKSFTLSGLNIVKTYETNVKALDDVTISIPDGEITVIMGPSGSGKTTLLNILALLDTPDSGKVLLDGKDTSKFDEKERARIRNEMFGFVFQFFHLIPELTVEENVIVPLMIRNPFISLCAYREKARKLLDEFHIGNKASSYPNKLSGGERQRVAICRSLIGEPKIIFADEPTGNLDKIAALELVDLIKTLNKEKKKTFVIATHNENFLKITTNIIYLSGGKIVNRE
ncbi:MAG: ABC transporter ATP-binding protein [Candidatus Omnitrophica bacterium]|nr:ABC transporter ATP-binding protein [Candidatus Omnitrophota bacterium]MCM8817197.1 ABC transporter ATP-binding protein [Candidatus Omnitrophota bacterium]